MAIVGKTFSTAVIPAVLFVICMSSVSAQRLSARPGGAGDDPPGRELSALPEAPAVHMWDNSLDVKVRGAAGAELPSMVHLELTFADAIAGTRAGVLRDGYCNAKNEYRFGQLPDGNYVVSASVAGFLPQRAEVHLYHGTAQELIITLSRAGSPDATRDTGTVSISWLAVPEKARKLYIKSTERFRKKDYDGAVKLLEQALEIDPNFAQAYNQLGLTCWTQDDTVRAEQFFRIAIAKDGKLLDAPLNLALILITKQSYAEAQQILEQATRKHPSRGEPFQLLGRVLYLEGELDKAEAASKQAIERDTNNTAEAHLVLANVYMKRNEISAAVAQLDAYLSAAPQGRYTQMARNYRDRLTAKPAAAPATAPAGSAATNSYTSHAVGERPH